MPTTKEARELFVRAELAERRAERSEAIVLAALVWSYTNDDDDAGRVAKNALLQAIELYEDDHPDATHDAIMASEALGTKGLRPTDAQPKEPR